MRCHALFLSLSVVAAAILGAASAQSPDPARLAAANEMMTRSGAVRQFDEAMPLIFDQLSKSFMMVAPGKSKEIREVFDQLVPRFIERKGELLDQIAALYAAELTLEELNAINTFYKSPAGLRFAGVQPSIMRQSMQLGQRWGQRIGGEIEQEALRELRRRGVDM